MLAIAQGGVHINGHACATPHHTERAHTCMHTYACTHKEAFTNAQEHSQTPTQSFSVLFSRTQTRTQTNTNLEFGEGCLQVPTSLCVYVPVRVSRHAVMHEYIGHTPQNTCTHSHARARACAKHGKRRRYICMGSKRPESPGLYRVRTLSQEPGLARAGMKCFVPRKPSRRLEASKL